MQYIKADTNTEVLIGPVVAVGDGFTPVTTLSLSTADEAEIIKYGGATPLTVTSISANGFSAITSADGYYTLDITTGNSDTEGFLTVLINDDSLCLPIRVDFMVVNANVYDSLFAAATTDYLQVDTIQVGGATEDIATETKQDVIDTNVDAILVDTGTSGVVLATNAVDATSVAANALSNGNFTAGYFNAINAECDTALTDYDAATGTELAATDAKIDIIDTNVDAVLVDTGTTIPATLGTPVADIATDIATVDGIVDNILTDTGTTLDTKINTIDTIVDNLNLGIIYGAAATGTLSTTQATSNLSGYADDQLIGRTIIFTSGACDGEGTDITDYASASGLLTFTALTTAPGNGDTFKIV